MKRLAKLEKSILGVLFPFLKVNLPDFFSWEPEIRRAFIFFGSYPEMSETLGQIMILKIIEFFFNA